MSETGTDRPIHLVPVFTAIEGRLPGTGFGNRYQRKYIPLKRPTNPATSTIRESLRAAPLSSSVRRIDPLPATPFPTQQHRLLKVELHPKSQDFDTIYPMRAADQAQSRHRFRGRILEVQDDRFLAVLEPTAAEEAQYEVEIPFRDLAPHQRDYIESGAEFSLSLSIRHGPEFDQQIRREFTFDDEADELPIFDADILERAREAAAQQHRKWEQSSEEDFGDVHQPADG